MGNNLEERAEIPFKRPLSVKEVREVLIPYISRGLRYNIVSNITFIETVRGANQNNPTPERTYAGFDCTMTKGTGLGVINFSGHGTESSLLVEELELVPPGGGKIRDYKPKAAQLWDDVREAINNYFQKQ